MTIITVAVYFVLINIIFERILSGL